jgi:hypothetical protein
MFLAELFLPLFLSKTIQRPLYSHLERDDPNDPESVDNFWEGANIAHNGKVIGTARRCGERGLQKNRLKFRSHDDYRLMLLNLLKIQARDGKHEWLMRYVSMYKFKDSVPFIFVMIF